MSEELKVLLVEDSSEDAELLIRALRRANLQVSWRQAESESELRVLLEGTAWDVVIADFSLPQFSALAALMMVRERELDLPFIVVSGVVGEETAVEAMRAGAHDFVTKDNLSRLAAVVQREVQGARERRIWREKAEAVVPPREEGSAPVLSRWEWSIPLLFATSLTLVVTVSVELLQEWFFPELTAWKASLLVIGVAGPVAATSIYFLVSRRQALMQRVIAEFVEHRRLNDMRLRLAERTRDLEAKMKDRQRREQHLEAQHAITVIMTGSRPVEEALPALLKSVCDRLDWAVGEYWSWDASTGSLGRVARQSADEAIHPSRAAVPIDPVLERIGLETWRTRKPVWIRDLREPESGLLSAGFDSVPFRSALSFPVRLGQEFLGVMVFASASSRPSDRELLVLLEDIGNQIGQFIERRRAETALQRAHEELELRVRRRTAELASLNEALSRSETNLRLAQQIAHLGSFEVYAPFGGTHGNYWSEEACRILGLEPPDVNLGLDLFVTRLVHAEDRARVQQELDRLQERRQPFELEYRVVKADGITRFVRMLGEPSFDDAGGLLKLVGTLQDITERKQLEKQVLEVSENEQRRIGQDLHDDLCQHLAGIEFMSQALHQRLHLKTETEAELARQVADLVRGAINQTRGLARGLSPVQLESRGLTAALQDLAEHVQQLFKVNCSFSADPMVEVRNVTVATHLYRIAQEAINNAIRHGKADRIEIALEGDEELACLRVGDNGAGFSPVHDETVKGMGMRIMHYRAGMIGASLNVTPQLQRGVLVECTFKNDV